MPTMAAKYPLRRDAAACAILAYPNSNHSTSRCCNDRRYTAGIYGFFAGLSSATQLQREQCFCWWKAGFVFVRRYRVGEQWFNLRPDALAGYRVGGQDVCFWLEWDRGTMNARDLEISLPRMLIASTRMSGHESSYACRCSFALHQISARRRGSIEWLRRDWRIFRELDLRTWHWIYSRVSLSSGIKQGFTPTTRPRASRRGTNRHLTMEERESFSPQMRCR